MILTSASSIIWSEFKNENKLDLSRDPAALAAARELEKAKIRLFRHDLPP